MDKSDMTCAGGLLSSKPPFLCFDSLEKGTVLFSRKKGLSCFVRFVIISLMCYHVGILYNGKEQLMMKILLLISLISVLFLMGCNENVNNIKIPENTDNVVVNNESIGGTDITNQLVEEVKVVVDYDNLVEDAYSQAEGENGADVSLPHINIESDDVNEINDKISSKIEKTKFWVNPEKYFYNRNGNVLSVVIESIYDSIYIDRADVYNIDLNNGKLLSNAELLANANINESNYDIKKIYKDEFKKENRSLLENEYEYAVRFYNSIDDKESKLSDEIMYLGSDNELHVLLQFPYMAGSDGMYFTDVKL